MKKNKKAFSLIEVITASIILTIAVFWVFKLIWENQKLINNSDNYKTATSLFIPLQECIENIYWTNIIIEKTYIDLNNCSTWTTKTWITLDNIDYILSLSWTLINNNFINYKLKINTDELNLEQDFKIVK